MSEFIKNFDYNQELLRIKAKRYGVSDEYNQKCIRMAIYGLDGEEKVAYQLRKYNKNILCLHNIRLKKGEEKIQIDFLLISKNYVFLVEVKNLYGNIRLNENGSVDRLVYKEKKQQVTSMINPLIQMNTHVEFMKEYLEKNNYNKKIESILVMGNNWTKIINHTKNNNVIRYDEIEEYLNKFIGDEKLDLTDSDLANKIVKDDIPYSFKNFNTIKNKMISSYVPVFKTDEEYELFEELIKLRRELSKKWNIQSQFLYNNKELERLIKARPLTAAEFLAVPGFKEKRFSMYGEIVISIFRKKENETYWLPKR